MATVQCSPCIANIVQAAPSLPSTIRALRIRFGLTESSTVVPNRPHSVPERLPKFDTISFRIGDPAKLSEVIAFTFWIDVHPFFCQAVQHTIQVVHLEIDHGFL